MGRLSVFNADEVIRKLRQAGFVFDRQARGSHEIWWNPSTHSRTTIPHHPGDMPEGTLHAILRQAKISVDDFLKL